MANPSSDRTAAVQDAPASTGVPPPGESGAAALAEQLARQMADAWRCGERPLAEAFLDRHPELRADPEAALRVIYEEICLRQEHEPSGDSLEVLRRFPQWQGELRGLLDCIDLLRPRTAAPAFPAVGDTLGDHLIVAELGRGALGRVFLAVQHSLADRPVVLKMTPRTGEEHLALARLQHTHIVPLYTAQDFPERNLRVLCMPYLGGASLGALLAALAPLPPRQRSGRLLLEELDRAQNDVGVSRPRQGKGRQRLANSSYEQAVCRAAECLAGALHYAHERGLVHLDLKPSNILLSADGEPLLLDFHLARGPVATGDCSPDWLGGTPGYMSPEQQAALDAVRAGRPVPAAVDARSDIYSLGVLLHEALAGAPPAGAAPPLRDKNPHVSVGLEDIVRKCLAADPAGRYASAAALADDLRRHLEDRPLRGVRNRSAGERWRKWRRRKPYALAMLLVSLALAGSLLAVSGLFLHEAGRRSDDARRLYEDGHRKMRARQYAQAQLAFQEGLESLGGLPGRHELRQALERDRQLARRAEKVWQLHELAERLRALAVVDGWSLRDRHVHAAACRKVWDGRALLTDRAGSPLEIALEAQVAPDLADLVLLWSDLQIGLAPPGAADAARRQALAALEEVEALIGPRLVLTRARQVHLERLGLAEPARGAAGRAADMAPGDAWEHCTLGRALLCAGDLAAAARQLRRAAELQPDAFWPRFYSGVCAYRQGHYAQALRAFDRSVGAGPWSGECRYYLGLTAAALGHKDEALREYSAAISLRPALGAAFLERGRLHAEQGRPAEALADLQQALNGGADAVAREARKVMDALRNEGRHLEGGKRP